MSSIENLTTFFGWCSVINIVAMLLAVLVASVFRESIGTLHAMIFGVTKEEAKKTTRGCGP